MRVAGYIEHPNFHVTVFHMNHRYSLKVEQGGFEQWYKLRPSAGLESVQDIESLLDEEFWQGVEKAFSGMHENWQRVLGRIAGSDDEDFDEIL